jgi:hypothetical protein
VVAVGEYLAAPALACRGAERGVDVLGRGDLEALHATREGVLVLGLHQHVDVRALDAEVAREPFGLRPAPLRLPPRRNSACCTCRLRTRFDVPAAMFHS